MIRILAVCLLIFHSALEPAEFVLFTQPKTGTHLLIPLLCELTQKSVYWAPEYVVSQPIQGRDVEVPQGHDYIWYNLDRAPWTRETFDIVWAANEQRGTFLHLHAPYSEGMEAYLSEKGCINFFIRRDPRDQIVSLLNHYKHIHFNDPEVECLSTDAERLLFMIRKESRAQTLHFMKWASSSCCCVLDFEKLMGAHGGAATDEDALEQMRAMAGALRLDLSDSQLMSVYKSCFGRGWGFFKGKVGVWRDYFNSEHKAAMKEEIGDLLIELGYEKDRNW